MWPRNLIKRAKTLKRRNEIDKMQDLRTTIILAGLKSQLPQDLEVESSDAVSTPRLSSYMKNNSLKKETVKLSSFNQLKKKDKAKQAQEKEIQKSAPRRHNSFRKVKPRRAASSNNESLKAMCSLFGKTAKAKKLKPLASQQTSIISSS